MAAIEVSVPHPICKTDLDRHRLRTYMVKASDTCISYCESFDNLNDTQIILMYLNFLLHSMYDGDQSRHPIPQFCACILAYH